VDKEKNEKQDDIDRLMIELDAKNAKITQLGQEIKVKQVKIVTLTDEADNDAQTIDQYKQDIHDKDDEIKTLNYKIQLIQTVTMVS
jgi:predicted  nucleic acid-binding Zn-ribbon protein